MFAKITRPLAPHKRAIRITDPATLIEELKKPNFYVRIETQKWTVKGTDFDPKRPLTYTDFDKVEDITTDELIKLISY